MSGFVRLHFAQAGFGAVGDIDPTAGDAAAEEAFDRLGHAGAGLPGSDDLNAIEIRQAIAALVDMQGFAVGLDMGAHGFLGVALR